MPNSQLLDEEAHLLTTQTFHSPQRDMWTDTVQHTFTHSALLPCAQIFNLYVSSVVWCVLCWKVPPKGALAPFMHFQFTSLPPLQLRFSEQIFSVWMFKNLSKHPSKHDSFCSRGYKCLPNYPLSWWVRISRACRGFQLGNKWSFFWGYVLKKGENWL